ncbi:glycogenin glucosyltransferase [Orbilia oligospora]|uniref:glycogenin glucosyltransferase n=1 Tax=Orbilia oligospora TaxID=2813651 RepID=A0A7C8P6M0_ORBOL|nr:glycogenin glucosyltransferase [Orbilia oligospora]
MEVYCTMLLTDGYLPGAQVLAHSLRDGGATRKLAILVTQDFLSEATMKELKRIYDYIIPVDRITNKSHGNLLMMDRLDLSSAFTKIHLWRMTQFEKIVYIDADVVALRAPEELFETKEKFAAAPDIGWPDCFNSGVMVLKPDLGTYHGLLNLANRGISFDGADQGLLNEYFRNWNRLSFVYNVTPSGHYQYAPAYNHYRSSITMAHFIGSNKPWAIGRHAGQENPTSAYGELLGRWWSIWDAHYRPVTEQDPALTWLSKGVGERLTIAEIERPNPMPTEYDPNFRREHTSFDERKDEPVGPPPSYSYHAQRQQQQQQQHYQPQIHAPRPVHPQWEEQGRRFSKEIPARIENSLPLPPLPSTTEEPQASEPKEKKSPSFEAPMQQWDAGRFSPPPNSRPEASNWPTQIYENEWDQAKQDTGLFVPPRVASPPTDLLNFEVPPKPQPSPRPSPIFPWEHGNTTPATRVFAGEGSPSPTLPLALPGSVDDEFETEEAAGGYSARGMAGWDSYSRTNAWDSIPSIERYVASFQQSTQPRRTVRKGDVTPNPQIRGADERILRTDGEHFDDETTIMTTTITSTTGLLPPEISVTPTPFKSLRGYRSHAMDDETKFPSAQGIPDQQHWDPMKSLAELRNAPGELLNRSPPSPQSLTRGSPRSPASSVQQQQQQLVSSSMPVPEKDFHITAYRKRHEMSISSGNSSVTGSPVNTFSERTYASSSTQTDVVELSDAGTQSDPEDIDAEMVMVGVH